MVQVLEKATGHAAATCYRRNWERTADVLNRTSGALYDRRESGMNIGEALRELAWTLADAWECADLRGHLAAWWDVVTGKVEVD